jgi:release factor glutamine methyltransferase
MASKSGAHVTASDLSEKAINNTKINAKKNKVNIEIVKSDLFTNIENKIFDWIIINPPYYARNPNTEEELAWHCGENFEYFKNLFFSLEKYINTSSNVVMVLTRGCDQETIFSIAKNVGFAFELLDEKTVLFDGKDFLYQIKKLSPLTKT